MAEKKEDSLATFIARQLEQGKKPNRLIDEKSPYLLQHAFNPVDWYPWGEEAFARARAEDKPIFLSVGYSTCHWCHVMEHESFESNDIAALMNANFVNIKVDREERPDVDRVYMAAVQALTGSGGWPMSVFLTPGLQPFYAGTYFPPSSKFGRPGFAEILEHLHQIWESRRPEVERSAEQLTDILQGQLSDAATDSLTAAPLEAVYDAFVRSYDSDYGGFGDAPKFPRPSVYNFLFRYGMRTGKKQAVEMALQTLRHMHAGGIYDHLGGGFSRYSVDRYWRVPHFEKMLYDQAQLVASFLDAFQVSGAPYFAGVARETLDYVLRDMTSPQGGFYSAEDADSAPDPAQPEHKTEGAFYLWSIAELEEALGKREAEIFAYVYGAAPEGNTLADPHGEFGDKNVLFAAYDASHAARRFGIDEEEVEAIVADGKKTLFARREQRPRPLRDDKIITAWNGLMISAFARAGMILNETKYSKAAARAADFILANLDDADAGLRRRYRDGEARYPGHLDDYAFFINGLLDLYEASRQIDYLQHADRLAGRMLAEFADSKQGGFFDSSSEATELIFRGKELYDGAEPSGTAMAVQALLRLQRMLAVDEYGDAAETALRGAAGFIRQAPSAFPQLGAVLDFALTPPAQIVIATDKASGDAQHLLAEVHRRYNPNRVLLHASGDEAQAWLAQRNEALRNMKPIDGKAAAYVCENFACELPVTEPEKLAELLDRR